MTARDRAPDDAPPLARGRRRRLSGEEEVLWQTVARSVRPLRRRQPAETAPQDESEPAPTPAKSKTPARAHAKAKAAAQPLAPPKPPIKPPAPALELLGRRDRKRIASGRHGIDARIDLHGRTQNEAYSALIAFIGRSRAQGARTVLVITGKGGDRNGDRGGERGGDWGSGPNRGQGGEGRGVLKRQVPLWLSLPELRASVIGFEPAASAHGGEGALYVRLRRPSGD